MTYQEHFNHIKWLDGVLSEHGKDHQPMNEKDLETSARFMRVVVQGPEHPQYQCIKDILA